MNVLTHDRIQLIARILNEPTALLIAAYPALRRCADRSIHDLGDELDTPTAGDSWTLCARLMGVPKEVAEVGGRVIDLATRHFWPQDVEIGVDFAAPMLQEATTAPEEAYLRWVYHETRYEGIDLLDAPLPLPLAA